MLLKAFLLFGMSMFENKCLSLHMPKSTERRGSCLTVFSWTWFFFISKATPYGAESKTSLSLSCSIFLRGLPLFALKIPCCVARMLTSALVQKISLRLVNLEEVSGIFYGSNLGGGGQLFKLISWNCSPSHVALGVVANASETCSHGEHFVLCI